METNPATNPTWSWLPPRVGKSILQKAAGAVRSRPCLAMLEHLDDRILLSNSTPAVDVTSILIGLLRNDIAVRQSELAALTLATGDLNPNDPTGLHKDDTAFIKLETDLQTLDQFIYATNVDGFNGRLNADKQQQALVKLDSLFKEIDSVVPQLDPTGGSQLLPAVQNIQNAALAALKTAFSIGAKVNDPTSNDLFSKVQNDLVKIDADVITASQDEIKLGPAADKVAADMDKLAADFNALSSDTALLGDGSVFKAVSDDLASIKFNTTEMLSGIPAPTDAQNSLTVLTTLLRNDIALRMNELTALEAATGGVDLFNGSNADEAAFLRLQTDFAKIDQIVHDFSLDAFNGRLSSGELDATQGKLDKVFSDIASLLPAISPSEGPNQLLPAVQNVEDAARAALVSASQAGKYKVDPTINDFFSKAEYDIVKIDDDVADFSNLEMKYGFDYHKTQDLFNRVGSDFDTLSKDVGSIADGSVKFGEELSDLETETINFMLGVPNPTPAEG